ncbi:MAG: lipoprotein signal peptidase [Lentimicrobiaceae bacterium]|jgi:signal peptidase II|nr:lipoprotein signal peptidase [Lentimicrobiaceae bacterium]
MQNFSRERISSAVLKKSLIIIFLVLLLDQVVKIWIKTHMTLGQEFPIFGNWFLINFTENEGMAFGMQFGGNYGKLLLSLFRLIAIGGIGYYIVYLIKKGAGTGLVICMSLILAGAFGNIIDSAFYGMLFSESTFIETARLLPAGGGYSTFLHGKVVDMLYFPIISGNYPSWVPFWGGKDFLLFRPVFNIADSAITIGVLTIIIFQRKLIKK